MKKTKLIFEGPLHHLPFKPTPLQLTKKLFGLFTESKHQLLLLRYYHNDVSGSGLSSPGTNNVITGRQAPTTYDS